MFNQALRRIANALSPSKQLPIRLCSTAFEPQTAPAVASSDIHHVSVTGKVLNIYSFENGTMTFYIKSVIPNGFSRMHKIVLTQRNAELLNLMKTNLALEQKLYIEGKLNTTRFQTNDGKHRSTSTIIATEAFIFSDVAAAQDSENAAKNDKTPPTVVADENLVELSGIITTGISGNNFKSFTLATLRAENLSRMNPKNMCFNRIFVYDEALFPLLTNIQVKKDEFLVRGEISYRMYEDRSGKNITSSYIKAKQIYRI